MQFFQQALEQCVLTHRYKQLSTRVVFATSEVINKVIVTFNIKVFSQLSVHRTFTTDKRKKHMGGTFLEL